MSDDVPLNNDKAEHVMGIIDLLLLGKGLNVNIDTIHEKFPGHGYSILERAIFLKNDKLVKFLLDKGADPNTEFNNENIISVAMKYKLKPENLMNNRK